MNHHFIIEQKCRLFRVKEFEAHFLVEMENKHLQTTLYLQKFQNQYQKFFS